MQGTLAQHSTVARRAGGDPLPLRLTSRTVISSPATGSHGVRCITLSDLQFVQDFAYKSVLALAASGSETQRKLQLQRGTFHNLNLKGTDWSHCFGQATRSTFQVHLTGTGTGRRTSKFKLNFNLKFKLNFNLKFKLNSDSESKSDSARTRRSCRACQ